MDELMKIRQESNHRFKIGNEIKRKNSERKIKAQALETRERAMEQFVETRKQLFTETGWSDEIKRRKRSADTLDWLREKIESDKRSTGRNKEKEGGKGKRKNEATFYFWN